MIRNCSIHLPNDHQACFRSDNRGIFSAQREKKGKDQRGRSAPMKIVWKSTAVGGLNPGGNFRYLLSTAATGSGLGRGPTASFISQIPARLFRGAKWMRAPAYRSANKGSKKNGNSPRTSRLSCWNIPRWSVQLQRETFKFPRVISLTKQHPTKKYTSVTFRRACRYTIRKWSARLIVRLNQKFIIRENHKALSCRSHYSSSPFMKMNCVVHKASIIP